MVHAYEDRPAHLSDPLKYPDPNEVVPESEAPRLDMRKKLFLCGNSGCKHDIRDHGAVPNPSVGNTAGHVRFLHVNAGNTSLQERWILRKKK